MPLYEYKCRKCGRRTEKIENIAGPHLKKCPYCGGKVESLISAPAIQFKGSGWYVTDYAGKSNSGDKSEEAKDEKSSTDKHKKDSPAKDSDSKESTKKETSPSERKAEKSEKKK